MSRTIVIGDIHGCFVELMDLFDRVGLGDDDTVVSVGDLVDRGPDTASVVGWFRARPGAVVVCGNHERKHVRGTLSYSQQIARLQLGPGYADAVAWMGRLPYHHETPEAIVVHAALIPGVPLAETPEDVLCGSAAGERKLEALLGGRRWHEVYEGDEPVVFGHHVVGPEPLVVRDRVYGIDTGACHGLRLTALVLPSFELVSVPARADHWPQVMRAWQVPVLRERDWASMPFEQIERKARELAREGEEGDVVQARQYLDGVLAWAAAVRAEIPALTERVDAEIARLREAHGPDADAFGRAAAAHPAGSTLLRRAAGKLGASSLGCARPADVLALAERLGVALAGVALP
jgi:serine/threonine protein phosphatase 1